MHRTQRAPAPRARGDRSGTFDDSGYVMALTALLIIPILAFTALAVDVGTWFARTAKIQRASDLAALAAVVWLPDTAKAQTVANQTLAANGFTSSNSTITVGTNGSATDQYKVTVKQNLPLPFGKMFLSNVQATRKAVAQFNKPIPLGSPSNSFGNNLAGYSTCVDPAAACAGTQPKLWAAIQGPFENFENGDAYATKCAGTTETESTCNVAANANGAQNSLYRKTGYMWGIDVPASAVGQTIQVQIYDAVQTGTSSTNPNADCTRGFGPNGGTGPYSSTGTPINGGNMLRESVNGSAGGSPTNCQPAHFSMELFNSDNSDLTISTDPSLSMGSTGSGGPGQGKCTGGTPGYRVVTATQSKDFSLNGQVQQLKNKWYTLCTFVAQYSGIHPLVIKTSAIPGQTDTGGGWNAYAVRATGPSNLRTYAITDMSIWNSTTGSSKFYLAEIPKVHAGKKLVVDLYDPGDGSGSDAFTMQFRTPPGCNGTCPTAVPGSSSGTIGCNFNLTKSTTIAPATPDTSANCSITTKAAGSGTGTYNAGWLRVVIQIPLSYNCTTDCWWTVNYNFGSSTVNDRTVWAINVVGDPVHLIE